MNERYFHIIIRRFIVWTITIPDSWEPCMNDGLCVVPEWSRFFVLKSSATENKEFKVIIESY